MQVVGKYHHSKCCGWNIQRLCPYRQPVIFRTPKRKRYEESDQGNEQKGKVVQVPGVEKHFRVCQVVPFKLTYDKPDNHDGTYQRQISSGMSLHNATVYGDTPYGKKTYIQKYSDVVCSIADEYQIRIVHDPAAYNRQGDDKQYTYKRIYSVLS